MDVLVVAALVGVCGVLFPIEIACSNNNYISNDKNTWFQFFESFAKHADGFGTSQTTPMLHGFTRNSTTSATAHKALNGLHAAGIHRLSSLSFSSLTLLLPALPVCLSHTVIDAHLKVVERG